jgi:hypothetical protein
MVLDIGLHFPTPALPESQDFREGRAFRLSGRDAETILIYIRTA